MSVTAKVKVVNLSLVNVGTEYKTAVVRLGADYGDDRNKEWAMATPVVNIEMHVKPEIADLFAFGQPFTLTFTPED